MYRRQFLVRSIALVLLAGSRAEAQPRTYRIAYLSGGFSGPPGPLPKALFDSLAELGYHEGQNLVVERRYADGRLERLPALAAELVALKPELIFAIGGQPSLVVSKTTSTIPIVFVGVGDPVGRGIVRSLARPGTNATGLSAQSIEIHGKRLQILKEAFPSASRVAVLYNPLNEDDLSRLTALKEASKTLGLQLHVVGASSGQELGPALKTLAMERLDVLYVIENPFNFSQRARIVEFANEARLPAVYGLHDFVEGGGLMSYSFIFIEQFRAAATFIDKILKGAKPSELPVEQPTRFELVLNLKAAKAQGVKFPPAILLRADRVIE